MKIGRNLGYLINNFKGYFFSAIILSTIFQLLILFPGIIAKEIFETLTGTATLQLTIVSLLILLALLPIINLISGQLVLYLSDTFKHLSSGIIRKNIFKQIFDMPGAKMINGISTQNLSKFKDDAEDIAQCIVNSISAISMTIFTIFAILIMLKINVYLTMATVVPMFLILILIKIAGKKLRKYRENSRQSTEALNHFVGELFTYTQIIKLYNVKNSMISKLGEINKERQEKCTKDKVLNDVLSQTSYNLVHLSLGIILLLGSSLLKSGSFTIGDFALFEYYFWFIGATFPYILSEFYKSYKQIPVAFSRLGTISEDIDVVRSLRLKDTNYKGSNNFNHEYLKMCNNKEIYEFTDIDVESLNYMYPRTNTGISDISFSLHKNSLTVITGDVGSGKTTLARVFLGQLKKNSGSVKIDGTLIKEEAEFFVPPFCGYTSQSPRFFMGTIKENILLGIDEHTVDMEKILYFSALDDDMGQFSNGLDTEVGVNGANLSGGQRKRLAMARMLACKPSLIVVDDYSSSLDINTEKTIWDRLFESKNYTCILVSHRKSIIDSADCVITLKKGKLASCNYKNK